MSNSKSRNALAVAILVLAVLSGIGLRAYGILQKSGLEHDEGISYLSATGNLGVYESATTEPGTRSLTGKWVKASEWKNLLKPNNTFPFALIGRDLAHYDIHPPLYFWFLHVWVLVFGVHLWAGPILNVVIFAVTAATLYGFASRIFPDKFDSALTVLLWSLSPAAVATSLMARQYDLATFFAVLFAWITCTHVYDEKSSGLRFWALLATVTLAGILSHYQFLLVVLPVGCVLIIASLVRRNVKKMAAGLASIAVGGLIAFALHPQFYLSFQRARENAETLDVLGLFHRILVALAGLGGFFTAILQRMTDSASLLGQDDTGIPGPGAVLDVLGRTEWLLIGCAALLVGLLILSALANARRTWTPQAVSEFFFSPLGFGLSFGLGFAGITFLGYLATLLPDHAMRERHLSILWPFASLWLVFLTRHCGRGKLFAVMLVVFMALSSLSFSSHMQHANTMRQNPEHLLSTSDRIVFDTVERGTLLPVLWHVPDDTLVYVDRQWNLPREADSWLNRLDGKSIFISVPKYGGTAEGREEILSLIQRRFCVERVQGFFWRWTTIYKIEDCKK